MFRLYVRPDATAALQRMRTNNNLPYVLSSRVKLSPEEYSSRMKKRERDYEANNLAPSHPLRELYDGTFYLVKVDEQYRRYYTRKTPPKL